MSKRHPFNLHPSAFILTFLEFVMAKIVAVTGCTSGVAHTLMAAEALKKIAKSMGHEIHVETLNTEGPRRELAQADVDAADAVIIASDIFVDVRRFSGKPMCAVPVSDAIRKTRAVIESALAEINGSGVAVEAAAVAAQPAPAAPAPVALPASTSTVQSLVAITSCPTGIAHTFMAAEALKKGAAALGHKIKVETQGSVGAKNLLTEDEIKAADAVIIAADTFVDTSRFAGKRMYQTSTKAALHDGPGVIKTALAAPVPVAGDLAGNVEKLKAQRSSGRTGPYKHLMTGVSYMLPLVTAGGLLIALAFAIGGIDAGKPELKNTFAGALMTIGGGAAFQLFVPVLGAFIAYSIADRPGITSGLVGGMLAQMLGAGFLGGIVAGFLAGYVTKFLNDWIQLPQNLSGLKPVLILPLLSTFAVGLAMIYVAGPPVKFALDGLTNWLNSMQQSSALVLGLILGLMMGFDMGGPVNKAAYTFSVGLLASKVGGPMAAAMAAGMTPPLGLALAATLFKNRFTSDERDAAKAAAVLGISFITEGAIPFAAKDPIRVIPCLMAGSAVCGAMSMALGSQLVVPHGGIFVLMIPNAVQRLGAYALSIVVGTVVTAAALWFVKRPIPTTVAAAA